MKKIILIATLTLSTIGYAQKIKGNGNVTTITRTTESYDAISCAGSFDFILVAGTEGTITLEGEENLLRYIITEVKGDKLIIKQKDKVNFNTSLNKSIKITIPFKDINRVSLSGSGDVWNEDVISSNKFEASLAGSGDVKLKIESQSVIASLAGSGDLTLIGNTDSLEASVSGSGDFVASKLECNITDISLTGSGNANVVSNKSLKARITGSGDIEYKGNPEKEDTKVIGSGSINKEE